MGHSTKLCFKNENGGPPLLDNVVNTRTCECGSDRLDWGPLSYAAGAPFAGRIPSNDWTFSQPSPIPNAWALKHGFQLTITPPPTVKQHHRCCFALFCPMKSAISTISMQIVEAPMLLVQHLEYALYQRDFVSCIDNHITGVFLLSAIAVLVAFRCSQLHDTSVQS